MPPLHTVTTTMQTCSIVSFLSASIQSYPHLLPWTLTDLQHLMNALKASFALKRRSLLENTDVSKSNGPDKISGWMLKATAHCSIHPSITKLFNLSIQLGSFPQTWKVSNVVPIPKSADNTSPTNCRPISLLSVLSKLLEWHMYCQITNHLETHHPLSSSQWGFQSGKSTVTALLEQLMGWPQDYAKWRKFHTLLV